jgi:hypothetical protein
MIQQKVLSQAKEF